MKYGMVKTSVGDVEVVKAVVGALDDDDVQECARIFRNIAVHVDICCQPEIARQLAEEELNRVIRTILILLAGVLRRRFHLEKKLLRFTAGFDSGSTTANSGLILAAGPLSFIVVVRAAR
jgi:hypothetical protein